MKSKLKAEMVTKNVPIRWYARICDAAIHTPARAVVEHAAKRGGNNCRQVIHVWLQKFTCKRGEREEVCEGMKINVSV